MPYSGILVLAIAVQVIGALLAIVIVVASVVTHRRHRHWHR
jgi:hypothetical protein